MSEDRHRSYVPQRCRRCGGPRERGRVDVTTSREYAETGKRSYVDGRWDQCAGCGSVEEPEAVRGVAPLGVTQRAAELGIVDNGAL